MPNAPGDVGLNNSNWTNYVNPGDIIGNYTPSDGDHYGNSVTLPGPASIFVPGEIDAENAANAATTGNLVSVANAMSGGQPGSLEGSIALAASTAAALYNHSLSTYAQNGGTTLTGSDNSAGDGVIATPAFTQQPSGNTSDDGSSVTVN